MSDELLFEKDGPVATLTLNRPERMNAITGPMLSVDYSARNEDLAAPALARLAERTREGARLLFIDDINDSGATIGRLREGLAAANAVAAVRADYAAHARAARRIAEEHLDANRVLSRLLSTVDA